jgi:hypothetical protein
MRTLPFIFLACLHAGMLQASTDQALADSAQAAYARGDQARALTLYDSLNTKWSSPDLLFNIGNCHFKLNDIPHAILYYERALRLAPGSEDVQANLDLARSKVADRVNELPAFTLGGSWDRTLAGTDNDQWARRSLWFMFLLCAFLAAWRIVRQRAIRGAMLGLGALAFIGLALSVLLAFRRMSDASNSSQAIVMAPRVDVRSEPRQGATTLFVLHEGTKVTVLQTNGDWNEVRLPNGSVGWMPPASLVRI